MVGTPGACRSGARESCQYQTTPAEARTVVLRSTRSEENVMAFGQFRRVPHSDGVLLSFVLTDGSDLRRMQAFCLYRTRSEMSEPRHTAIFSENPSPLGNEYVACKSLKGHRHTSFLGDLLRSSFSPSPTSCQASVVDKAWHKWTRII